VKIQARCAGAGNSGNPRKRQEHSTPTEGDRDAGHGVAGKHAAYISNTVYKA
jgi:hypothetical protein